MKTNKSPGQDGIYPEDPKEFKCEVVDRLTRKSNVSLKSAVNWNLANVTPVLKGI